MSKKVVVNFHGKMSRIRQKEIVTLARILISRMDEAIEQLAALDAKVSSVLRKENIIMADLTNLTTAVTANGDAEQSAITLLNGLAEQLRAAATDPAAIQALADQITQQSGDLAAAVVANTPAA